MVRTQKPNGRNNKKKPEEKLNKKNVEDPKKSKAEELPPFTLVLYGSDKKKGVVETKSIPKASRHPGAQCMAPLPLDLNPSQSKETHRANVISFGYDIDFLYDVNLNIDGKVLEQEKSPPSEEATTVAAIAKATERKKAENISKINHESAQGEVTYKDLFPDTQSLGKSSDNSSEISKKQQDSSAPFSTSETDEVTLSPQESDVTIEPDVQSFVHEDEDTNDCCEAQSVQCPLLEVMQQATPENLAFLNAFTTSNMKFLQNVVEAATKHMETSCSLSNTATTKPMQRSSVSKIKRSSTVCKLDLQKLECSKPDTEKKYNIARGVPIYLLRHEYVSLPPIVGMKTAETVREPIEPRAMANLLLDKLVPLELQKNNTATTLPDELTDGILAYINSRLPEESRLKRSKVKEYMSDRCRQHNRDRVIESAKRKCPNPDSPQPKRRSKKKHSQAVTLSTLTNLTAKEVVLPDGTVQTLYQLS